MTRRKNLKLLSIVTVMLLLLPRVIAAEDCSDKLFSVTIDSTLTIGDAVENLAETCDLTLIVKDSGAKHRLDKKIYYVKLKNASMRSFLDTILSENDLNYELRGNKLSISYLVTRTFKVHYIAGKRSGKSDAHVTIANSGGTGGDSSSKSKTGISITSDDTFKFWSTIKDEVHRILVSAGDGGTHYTKVGDAWVGPDGQKWEYNPLEPIVNAEAGMVTVTGTSRQVKRVSRYIASLAKQIKSQVLIDVKILTVTFDNSNTTGIDWSQLYALQNFNIKKLITSRSNLGPGLEWDEDRISGQAPDATAPNLTTGAIIADGATTVTEVVKFLKTQGDVRAVSSPRVMTLNNQPALISVGRELFYKLKSSTQQSGTGSSSSTEGEMIDSVFAGVLLDITPEIDSRGMVTLKINPSITETTGVVSADSGSRTMPPDLVRRQVASVIKVKDGNHAILGGLISKTTGTKVNKVPLLGDIPLLEYAFKREQKIEKTEELVIIITPHIVKNNRNLSLSDLGYKRLK